MNRRHFLRRSAELAAGAAAAASGLNASPAEARGLSPQEYVELGTKTRDLAHALLQKTAEYFERSTDAATREYAHVLRVALDTHAPPEGGDEFTRTHVARIFAHDQSANGVLGAMRSLASLLRGIERRASLGTQPPEFFKYLQSVKQHAQAIEDEYNRKRSEPSR